MRITVLRVGAAALGTVALALGLGAGTASAAPADSSQLPVTGLADLPEINVVKIDAVNIASPLLGPGILS
ncbi:hypothetical protein [Actinokineospora sp. NBRC 105648]|uniref:hypothetical protein n=1 Tax=Actinokineospora sp. NBRC 105648 TaxID=3032206 RepID=UPI00249FB81D|nr:hypothetical protein [Actinokineospora sp. NBRC 105648]GLZ39554.1 hypothetical protein Acsp05_31780 [Actinokineospora sp. NBRC 105648]